MPDSTSDTTGTITSATPLRVRVDGATSDSPAATLNAQTFSVGARVQVTVRNPRPPLVVGIETFA